jgi:hypothetical protein
MDSRVYLIVIIILMASPFSVLAQQNGAGASGEVLTLDEAISLALRDNREVKNAQLAMGKAEDQLAAARTYRRPKFEFNELTGPDVLRANGWDDGRDVHHLAVGSGDLFDLRARSQTESESYKMSSNAA